MISKTVSPCLIALSFLAPRPALAQEPVSAAPTAPATTTPTADAAVPTSQQPSSQPQGEPASTTPAKAATAYTALQQELAQVMDDLVQARARVALLGKALFKTKVRVQIDNQAATDQVALRAALWLDGAPIWKGDGSGLSDPKRALFEGFATPGPHVLTLEIEQRARGDQAYRYTLRQSYRFLVLKERRTDLRLVLEDDSDIAEDWEDDHEGEYDVRTTLEVQAVALQDE